MTSHSINAGSMSKIEDNDFTFSEDVNPEDLDSNDTTIDRSDEEAFIKRIPIDRYHFAYFVFYLLGINTLIPWTFFVTAEDYWYYKFRDVTNSSSHVSNFTYDAKNKTNLQASFTSYLCIASALPNTLFLIINTLISNRISLSTRMIASQGVVLAVFILTTSFAKVNTDSYQSNFLIITLTSVAVVNAASAIFGGSLCGVVGKFSSKYITAMTAGQALSGIFSALTEILSLWIGANPVVSGLFYFIIADVVLLMSLIAYVILERVVFFKYHVVVKPQDPNETEFSIHNEVNFSRDISYSQILKKTWPYCTSIFLIFVITTLVCPAVTVLVESQRKGHGYAWNDVYFVPVATFLIYSCSDYVGRILSGILNWPKNKPWLVVLLTFLRIFFIPAFLLCNAQPRHHLPVMIHQDLSYIVLTILFGLTNGYFCNLSFMLTPTVVEPKEREVASAMMGAFLGIGISIGSSLSILMVKIL